MTMSGHYSEERMLSTYGQSIDGNLSPQQPDRQRPQLHRKPFRAWVSQ